MEEGIDRCKLNFKAIWQGQGCRMKKLLCWYLLPFGHSAYTDGEQ